MILVASQRGGARQLAAHLLNAIDNDHVAVQELRGFISDDLRGAFDETRAMARGTRCKQYLVSLSLNPPKDGNASIEDLTAAADRAQDALGLTGQPRALIVHEKNGRRHAHLVVSRIVAQEMKAVPLPFFKTKLAALSKELYLEHGWELPEGHRTNGWKNPLNFTLAEWQQAKRLDLDPREIKQVFQEAWKQSDSLPAFKNALEQNGYYLAQGDRRGHVTVDINGEVFAVARWTGIKAKQARERLGEPDGLPSVATVQTDIKRRISERLRGFIKDDRQQQAEALKPLAEERRVMVKAQRRERQYLTEGQEVRHNAEAQARAARLQKGLRGAWQRLNGGARAIRRENEADAYRGFVRDRQQRETLVRAQIKDRAVLQERIDGLRHRQRVERLRIVRRIAEVLRLSAPPASDHQSTPQRPRRNRDFGLNL